MRGGDLTKILIIALWLFASPLSGQQLEIHFLNVGQGDAAIIQEGGRTAVIDAGPSGIGAYLKSLHVDTIDLIVASHPHADHIGGMPELLQSHLVRFYLDNGVPYTTGIYRQTLDAVRANGAQYLNATNRTITLGAAQLHILAPPPNTTINTAPSAFSSSTRSFARSSPATQSKKSCATGLPKA